VLTVGHERDKCGLARQLESNIPCAAAVAHFAGYQASRAEDKPLAVFVEEQHRAGQALA
jgi:hypothetical protein